MDKTLKKLKEAYKLLENNESFEEWFGDSKVVDENGKPLIVYHGTKVNFSKFDPSYIGSRFGKDTKGFFFTRDSSAALGGAGDYGSNGFIKKAYLRIENPVTLEEYANSLDSTVSEIMYYGGDEIPVITIWDEDKEDILKLVNEKGADGVILSHESLHPMNAIYIVFDTDQIRIKE